MVAAAPPHTRGWTHDAAGRGAGVVGSPAHAGMDPCSPTSPFRPGWLPRTRGDRPPRVMIAIHVDPEVRDQLRAIAYEQKVPLRGLVCAGLNAVFAQHHKPEIAR